MSTLDPYTSGTRPAASGNTGLCIFRTDTNAIEVSDGRLGKLIIVTVRLDGQAVIHTH